VWDAEQTLGRQTGCRDEDYLFGIEVYRSSGVWFDQKQRDILGSYKDRIVDT